MTAATTPAPPWTFTMPMTVGEADIDEIGHANNIAYVRWIQDVALGHSAAVGFDFDAYKRIGGVFVVRRHEIDYLRSVLRGDVLELRTRVDRAMAAKCFRMTEIANAEGVVVLRAVTTWGWIDLASGRPARIPEAVRSAFGITSA